MQRMWPASGYRSILLDKSDRPLVAIDRTIRSALSNGLPGRWTPPHKSELGDRSEAHFLLGLYRTIFHSNHGHTQEALTALRRIMQESETAQIRARAAQYWCQILLTESLDRGQDNQREAEQRSEKECGDLCERAATEFKDFDWSGTISHIFHAALGILDYYSGDRLAAKFHLSRSLEQYSRIRNRYDKSTWVIALVHYYTGVLANESNDVPNALKYLKIAVTEVPPQMEITALMQLASASLKAGDARGAKKFAKRGLKSPSLKELGKEITSELKAWLAEAELDLGRKRDAAKLFQELIESGDAPHWESRARQILRTIAKDA